MITYQEFIEENSRRQPETQTVTANSDSGGLYVQATAPTGATERSLWFNTNLQDSRLYVRYDNNWIGIRT